MTRPAKGVMSQNQSEASVQPVAGSPSSAEQKARPPAAISVAAIQPSKEVTAALNFFNQEIEQLNQEISSTDSKKLTPITWNKILEEKEALILDESCYLTKIRRRLKLKYHPDKNQNPDAKIRWEAIEKNEQEIKNFLQYQFGTALAFLAKKQAF